MHPRRACVVVAIIVAFGYHGATAAAQASATDVPLLWRTGTELPLALIDADTVEVRARSIELDDLGWATADARSRVVAVELFDGEVATLALERRTTPRPGAATWSGTLGDGFDGVMLAVVGDAMAATIRLDGELYRVRTLPVEHGGGHVLTLLDPSHALSCGSGPSTSVAPVDAADPSPPSGGAEGGNPWSYTMVEVLVAYTSAAKAAAGGLDGMLALIDLAVLETNTSYVNGNAGLLMRLVLTHEVDYTELNGLNANLNRFQLKYDGYMDEVHALREQVGADACALLTEADDPDLCGIAYLMGWPAGQGFGSFAFNVTERSCATGYYTFGHEFGHNFGLDHDLPNATGNTTAPYAYGYGTPGGEYHTVMALAGGLRVPVFSSPLAAWDGFRMGEVDVADNGRTLTDNNSVIMDFWNAFTPFADCNNNLVDDELELSFGFVTDGDGNGVPDQCTFEDLGFALAGSYGDPSLLGAGTLVEGDPVTIKLSGAREYAPAFFVVGLERVDLPFYGGTLVPAFGPPLGLAVLLVTDGAGGIVLQVDFPAGIPSGTEIYLQYWIEDVASAPFEPHVSAAPFTGSAPTSHTGVGQGPEFAGGPFGLAASNAIVGTTP